ncbi:MULTISPECIES: energy-coupling factor ABC transporter ATP-binding protein [Exiguobacterium]|uniref:energy-coupling factor ABC transporter ATP-binding protein n=1 Tax=Exiguobacterium TaxID=33986 RepID=UPI00047A9B19|nr:MULTISPECIES: energy-coupling factor ABC transporter ATP-binding protein [Exiguobacterium]MCK2158957.1 energy-coupling factor ABC transporter ATP-binding protein [Exiguobacterium sp. 17-1]MCT4791147.1 energy-coupling factor ABC transporter ATP-binding protein [Exiguobacterium artemiae]MDW2886791.1 energy-coupling factor ABC transporter ATP-binding protein [Exiguobacterium sibiricum]QNR19794.1 energy-coupling factor ABC transporter ATP-binding protein [Exiguobacterium sp. Helios]RDB32164.1 e
MTKLIELEQVTYRYPEQEQPALRNVSLSIHSQEWVAIVGHNGSGKSTLTKLFNGLLLPEEGTVTVNETFSSAVPEQLWEMRRAIGIVFQNPDNQFVGTTVRDDVAFALENWGVPREEMVRRIDDSLARVGLTDFVDREPHQLSGGQKQRVAIASALAMRPDVLVLDEATSMLDPIARTEVMSTVQELYEQHPMAVVAITHELDEVLRASRVIVMDAGQIVLEGTPQEVFAQSAFLEQIGLDVPFVVRVQEQLSARGLTYEDTILDERDLVNRLCQS